MPIVVHVLTDELFRLSGDSIYGKPAVNNAYQEIVRHMDNIDTIIVQRYPYKNNITKVLDNLTKCEITDYIAWEEIRTCKDYVLRHFFMKEEIIKIPAYFMYDKVIEFINEAAYNIVERLSDGIDFPVMFCPKFTRQPQKLKTNILP